MSRQRCSRFWGDHIQGALKPEADGSARQSPVRRFGSRREIKMRIMRRLFLSGVASVIAMAFMASIATAQSVEIVLESNNQHCSAVPNSATGGCAIKGLGEVTLVEHLWGIEFTASDCNVAFEGRIDEDGEGFIYGASYTGDAGHNCTRTPCDLPWSIHAEEHGGGIETLDVPFCARNSDTVNQKALATIPLTDAGDHAYRLTFNDLGTLNITGCVDCELTGGLVNIVVDAAHPGIKIIHTP
jgi:hypothetical protein